jgi:hypothetical protein
MNLLRVAANERAFHRLTRSQAKRVSAGWNAWPEPCCQYQNKIDDAFSQLSG